jgi:hypothetical protein
VVRDDETIPSSNPVSTSTQIFLFRWRHFYSELLSKVGQSNANLSLKSHHRYAQAQHPHKKGGGKGLPERAPD